jgi:hypothetical protein
MSDGPGSHTASLNSPASDCSETRDRGVRGSRRSVRSPSLPSSWLRDSLPNGSSSLPRPYWIPATRTSRRLPALEVCPSAFPPASERQQWCAGVSLHRSSPSQLPVLIPASVLLLSFSPLCVPITPPIPIPIHPTSSSPARDTEELTILCSALVWYTLAMLYEYANDLCTACVRPCCCVLSCALRSIERVMWLYGCMVVWEQRKRNAMSPLSLLLCAPLGLLLRLA